MNITAANFWVSIGQWIFDVLVGWYIWQSKKYQATNNRFEKMHADLDKKVGGIETGLDKKITSVETELKSKVTCAEKDILEIRADVAHLPGQQQISDLNQNIGVLNREIGELKGSLKGVNRAVDLMNEYLINKKD